MYQEVSELTCTTVYQEKQIYVYISMLKVCKVSGFVSYIYKQHLVYYVKKNTLMNGGDYLLIIPLPRSKISFVLRINILTNNFTS